MDLRSDATPLSVLWRFRIAILRDALILTVVMAAGSLLVPNKFTATTTILPPTDSSDIAGLFSALPGAAALSRGLGLEGGGQTDIYLGVLKSTRVNRQLVQRFDLVNVYRRRDVERAGKALASNTAIVLSNEGFLRVSVTDRTPNRAARLANAYVEELDAFLRTNTNTTARRRREFLEQRLADVRPALEKSENALRDFQMKSKMTASGLESDRSAAAAAELMAEKVRREVELGIIESVSLSTQPRAEELRNELRQIDLEIMKIPPAATDMLRLMREVKIQERVLLILTEEYERARVMEAKNIPVVEVVDRAEIPLHKSSPRRALIAVATFLLALAGGAALRLARERVRIA